MKEKNIFKLLILSILISSNLFAQSINYPDSSVLAHGDWYKFSISSSGLYKLTYNDFISLGIPAEKIKSSNLSIYGNGGRAVSSDNSKWNFSDLKENSIYVYDPNNNFSQGGYVIFYGEGGTDWKYNRINKTWGFDLHPYSDQYSYFITFNDSIGEKKRINTISNQSLITDTVSISTRDFFLSKQELVNIEKSGRLWVGKQYTSNKTEEYPLDLRNALVDQNNNLLKPALIEYKFVAQSGTNTTFLINYNNTDIDTMTFPGNTSVTDGDKVNDKIFIKNLTKVKPTNKTSVTFNGGPTSKGWLDYILVNYDKKLQYNYPSVLKYYTTEFLGLNLNVENIISNVTNENVLVWDVSNWTNPTQIKGTYNSTDKTYSVILNSDSIKNIVVFNTNSNFNTIKPIGKIENQNLHATEAADYVIITHPLFIEQAERLAKLHKEHNNVTTTVVTTEDIYNEFSSGTPDYLAYKEFMRMLYTKYLPEGKNPKNVLLFGDGTYDNKNILKYNNNLILTYQTDNKEHGGFTTPCDDYITYLSPEAKGIEDVRERDSMMVGVGRFPVNNVAQAEIMVDKSQRYLLKEDILNKEGVTDWRNTSILTADDADNTSDRDFIKFAENIYNQIKFEQPQINAVKIYSDAYKQYASSSGNTYPDASKAINHQMKKGGLIFNYVGHGSEDHLSSERLITISDMTSWKNYHAMPLMITSTCEFARFDLVDKPSAAENTLYNRNGGMIALISAARPIYANDGMNRHFHKYILEVLPNNQTRTFGEAFSATKNDTGSGMRYDQRSVVLLGDPALRISLPKYNVTTLKINDIDPEVQNDTLRALSTVKVEGRIEDWNHNLVEDFNGYVQVTLFDKSSKYYTLDNENNNSKIEFEQQKDVLHKGKAKVENGLFTHTFIVPKVIAYNYGYGKLSYYAYSDSSDATGYCNKVIVGGIDNDAVFEETRPLVRLFIGDSNFVSGGITNENPELFAIISDKVPINTSSSVIMSATLDNAANTFILNDYFVQSETDPNKGYINFPFTLLSEGEHTLTLIARNILDLSSSATITFNVVSKNKETYANLKNYPNPFSG
ncbi:MAG TPA: type IX secretion system sortase PorU, partial [Bacteroidales bacterium]|nr:type IX secretion system sortase PorU [Bacteroidales bacterium]